MSSDITKFVHTDFFREFYVGQCNYIHIPTSFSLWAMELCRIQLSNWNFIMSNESMSDPVIQYMFLLIKKVYIRQCTNIKINSKRQKDKENKNLRRGYELFEDIGTFYKRNKPFRSPSRAPCQDLWILNIRKLYMTTIIIFTHKLRHLYPYFDLPHDRRHSQRNPIVSITTNTSPANTVFILRPKFI